MRSQFAKMETGKVDSDEKTILGAHGTGSTVQLARGRPQYKLKFGDTQKFC